MEHGTASPFSNLAPADTSYVGDHEHEAICAITGPLDLRVSKRVGIMGCQSSHTRLGLQAVPQM